MYQAEQKLETALTAVRNAQREVDEPQPSDKYFVVKGLRSRNKFGSVVLTKSEGKHTKVLLAIQDESGEVVVQKWFPLKKLKRSLAYQGLV